jgi:hypothetical protein
MTEVEVISEFSNEAIDLLPPELNVRSKHFLATSLILFPLTAPAILLQILLFPNPNTLRKLAGKPPIDHRDSLHLILD